MLIHAAAGGVGSAAVQLAKAAGARVFGTASGDKRDAVLGFGADVFIGLSAPGALTGDDIKRMNDKAIIFALANPTPEILPEADTAYRAAHANIFPTLLDLMNFPESERQKNYSSSLLKTRRTDSKPRFYFSGNLHSKISAGRFSFDE